MTTATAAKSPVQKIPAGYHTVTPYLTLNSAKAAMEFYKKALGAEVLDVITDPSGEKVMHAEIKIGDSRVMLGDEFPEMGVLGPLNRGGCTGSLLLYVEDADAAFNRAVAAGAMPLMPMCDAFWGDRFGKVVDPFGHQWAFATHLEDVPPEEMPARMAASFAKTAAADGSK